MLTAGALRQPLKGGADGFRGLPHGLLARHAAQLGIEKLGRPPEAGRTPRVGRPPFVNTLPFAAKGEGRGGDAPGLV